MADLQQMLFLKTENDINDMEIETCSMSDYKSDGPESGLVEQSDDTTTSCEVSICASLVTDSVDKSNPTKTTINPGDSNFDTSVITDKTNQQTVTNNEDSMKVNENFDYVLGKSANQDNLISEIPIKSKQSDNRITTKSEESVTTFHTDGTTGLNYDPKTVSQDNYVSEISGITTQPKCNTVENFEESATVTHTSSKLDLDPKILYRNRDDGTSNHSKMTLRTRTVSQDNFVHEISASISEKTIEQTDECSGEPKSTGTVSSIEYTKKGLVLDSQLSLEQGLDHVSFTSIDATRGSPCNEMSTISNTTTDASLAEETSQSSHQLVILESTATTETVKCGTHESQSLKQASYNDDSSYINVNLKNIGSTENSFSDILSVSILSSPALNNPTAEKEDKDKSTANPSTADVPSGNPPERVSSSLIDQHRFEGAPIVQGQTTNCRSIDYDKFIKIGTMLACEEEFESIKQLSEKSNEEGNQKLTDNAQSSGIKVHDNSIEEIRIDEKMIILTEVENFATFTSPKTELKAKSTSPYQRTYKRNFRHTRTRTSSGCAIC